MKLGEFVRNFSLRTVERVRAAKLGKTDFGVLKVACMVAALDGEITDAEYAAFEALAQKCRGYTAETAAKALDEAMRSAGYLLLLSRRVSDEELVSAFTDEALAALPDGFAYLSIEEVRRAVVTWIAMGLSDGDYSPRERLCIEKLRKLFAELKVMRVQAESERWLDLVPAIDDAGGSGTTGTVELVSKDFVVRVEELVAQYGDSADAAKELEELIAGRGGAK